MRRRSCIEMRLLDPVNIHLAKLFFLPNIKTGFNNLCRDEKDILEAFALTAKHENCVERETHGRPM
jgi:hypothetical protein